MIIDPLSPSEKTADSTGESIKPEQSLPPHTEEFDILLTNGYEDEEPPVVSEAKAEPAAVPIASGEETIAGDDDLFTAFPELQDLSPDKFTYREIFSRTEKHGYRSKENRRALKIVQAVHDLLTTGILADGEKVLRVARGIAYHPFEIPYANGLLTILSNYFAIVCTDTRLLLINLNRRLTRPTRYTFQIPYNGIAGISRGVFLSSLIIAGRSGRNWNFTTVNRSLAGSIKDFVAARLDKSSPAPIDNKLSMPQLCPSCHTPLPAGFAACPHCSAAFKKPREALLRSLILPGFGSIYLGYHPLGIMEITGYLFSWLLSVALMVLEAPGGIGVAIIPVAAYHLTAGLLAWKTAGKGYLVENL
jgi:hypothetical protein